MKVPALTDSGRPQCGGRSTAIEAVDTDDPPIGLAWGTGLKLAPAGVNISLAAETSKHQFLDIKTSKAYVSRHADHLESR
jgi:hypothetical protein